MATLRSIYVRGNGPSIPLYFDNSDLNKELYEAMLFEVKGLTSVPSKLKSSQSALPSKAILEVTKNLPISESQVRTILKKTHKHARKSHPNKTRGKLCLSSTKS